MHANVGLSHLDFLSTALTTSNGSPRLRKAETALRFYEILTFVPFSKALLLLKKKRYQDQLLDKTDNQISNLERMVQDLEFAQIEKKVIDGLRVGNECLKKMQQVMSVEEVERILDETQDAIEYQRQIDEMLSGSLSQDDEDAVLAELEAITQEDVLLPDVPSHQLPNAPEAAEEKAATERPRKKAEMLAA